MTELDLADSMWNCTETWNMFLQLDLQTHPAHLETVTADEAWTKWTWTGRSHVDLLSLWTEANNKLRHSELTTSLPKVFAYISSGIVIATFLCLFLMSMWLLIRGLPKKAPRHSSVNEGCPTSWILFLCLTYTFIWFTTDQYVPSLPQMGRDLSGSQSIMSATVQLNVVIKAITGLFTASLSDRIGRRPALVTGLFLLAFASFCCGCAASIEWFVAARILQAVGESVEPVVIAACRDYFPNNNDRLAMIAALLVLAMTGMVFAPVFGGFLAQYFSWRCSFFVLAIIWMSLALYAYATMVESCPDDAVGEHSYSEALSQILAPGPVCLLLTSACIASCWLVFSSNIAFVAQETYGQTTMGTSFIMLTWAAFCVMGLLFMKWLQGTRELSAQQSATVQILFVTSVAIVSLVLTASFSQKFWAYLLASFLQAFVQSSTLVPVSVLYYEPLANCAGVAASIEILFKSLPPCIYCMICTEALIHDGIKIYMNLQSGTCIGASLSFLGYLVMSRRTAAAESAEKSQEALPNQYG